MSDRRGWKYIETSGVHENALMGVKNVISFSDASDRMVDRPPLVFSH